jgi:hypothetical protein
LFVLVFVEFTLPPVAVADALPPVALDVDEDVALVLGLVLGVGVAGTQMNAMPSTTS